MTWKIYKIKNLEGTLSVSGDSIELYDDCSDNLRSVVRDALAGGVTRYRDVHDHESGERTLVSELVSRKAPHFLLVFKEYLQRNGYRVSEEHPELVNEIRTLLARLPDTEQKTQLFEGLATMSYLEQTFLYETLKSKI